jgi:hypothetical protein
VSTDQREVLSFLIALQMDAQSVLGLVLTRRGQVPHSIGAAEFNRATIYNSREFVTHHPGWLPGQSLRQAFDEDVCTQRWILPMILEGSTSRA